MPRGRKRKDADEAPIDADYRLDVVRNKEKGFRYAWVSDDDMPLMRARGYSRVERSTDPDATAPAFDSANAEDTEFRVGRNRLLLMKIPEERARRIEAGPLQEAAARVAAIKLNAQGGAGGGVAIGGDGVNQQVEA